MMTAALVAGSGLVAGCGADDDPSTMSPVADDAEEIAVTADGFAFDPDTVTVSSAQDVAIGLTSVDMLHDLTVEELDVQVTADQGETATGRLRADQPGRYTFYCSVSGHRTAGMEGTLVVEG